MTGSLRVSLNTNPFSKDPQYSKGIEVRLPLPTDNTGELIRWANKAVERIYLKGLIYKAACVELDDLVPKDQVQQDLFVTQDHSKDMRLMGALDRISKDFGAGRLRYLSEGLVRDWDTRFGNRSPRYTTRWEELLTVRAS